MSAELLRHQGTKICGVSTIDAIDAAAAGGARFVGLVFFPPSPRFVDTRQARGLVEHAHALGLQVVGVFVDPDDALLEAADALGLDLLQLHGDEDVARARAVQARYGKPVIKALKIGNAADLARAAAYDGVTDYLLLDARPPKDALLPGGNGAAFDWTLLSQWSVTTPWFLSGGLNPDNVNAAILATGARLLDVSSGVERAPGQKDLTLIHAFLANSRTVAA